MEPEGMDGAPLWVRVEGVSLGLLCIGIVIINVSWTLGVRVVCVSLAAIIAVWIFVKDEEQEKWAEEHRKKNPWEGWVFSGAVWDDLEKELVVGRENVKRLVRQRAMVGALAEKTGKTLEEWFADLDTLNAEYKQKHNTGMMIRNMKKHLKKNCGFDDYQTKTVVKLYLKGRRARKRRKEKEAAMVRSLAEKTGNTLEEWFVGLDTFNAKADPELREYKFGMFTLEERRIFYMKKFLKKLDLDDYQAETVFKLYLERRGKEKWREERVVSID